ncbi:MAG: ribosome silencing factor [Sphaerospermopsis sp. SIO1G2]|nr:ribosome silencing factor [Sphaerospermopsis sp. SIO1G2]
MATSHWNGDSDALARVIIASLENDKAEDVSVIDLRGKTSIADTMIIADGRSARHVGSMADKLATTLKEIGAPYIAVEGLESCDWVLLDAGDIVVHLFRPTVREIYNLERMWTVSMPEDMSQVTMA